MYYCRHSYLLLSICVRLYLRNKRPKKYKNAVCRAWKSNFLHLSVVSLFLTKLQRQWITRPACICKFPWWIKVNLYSACLHWYLLQLSRFILYRSVIQCVSQWVAKVGSNLKSNHHVRIAQIGDTHCISLDLFHTALW